MEIYEKLAILLKNDSTDVSLWILIPDINATIKNFDCIFTDTVTRISFHLGENLSKCHLEDRAGEMDFKVGGLWNTGKYCQPPWLTDKKNFQILDALEWLRQ